MIEQFLENPYYVSALTLTWLFIWIFEIYILIKAKRIERSYRDNVVVVQYEPPPNITPIMAHYLLSFGGLGRTYKDLSRSSEHLLVLIYLYERGLITDLEIQEKKPAIVKYKISEDFLNKSAYEEERIFLQKLVEAGGMKEAMTEVTSRNDDVGRGFDKINKFWVAYWCKDLFNIAKNMGLADSPKSGKYIFLEIFMLTLGLGFFLFIFIIPLLDIPLFHLGLLLIFPQALLFFAFLLVLKIINNPIIINFLGSFSSAIPSLVLFSWFVWIIINGLNATKIFIRFSNKSRPIYQWLYGYKKFLRGVDLNSLSIIGKEKIDSRINHTTFPWLLVFKLANHKHWAQWRQAQQQVTP